MAGITVSVNPEIINWVLQKIQFENVSGSAIELLGKWKTGEKTPTFNQVETMSKRINIPFGYFFLSEPPADECAIVDYRTVKSTPVSEPSRNLVDTLDLMTDIQEWMIDYVIENGQEELSFVGSAAGQKDAVYIARNIRNTLDIKEDWYSMTSSANDSFRTLREYIENLGILVMMNGIVGNNTKRKLNLNEFRAFTLVNKYVPLIFINTCDYENGKLFSILHELCHIWIGIDSLYNNKMNDEPESDLERICNAVTAELLVPERIFKNRWGQETGTHFEKVKSLAKYFKCSQFVIVRRARDFGFISQSDYDDIVAVLTEQVEQWKAKGSTSGGNYYSTIQSRLDHRLVRALANSAREGRTQYTEVYRLTNTNRRTFNKLLETIGGLG